MDATKACRKFPNESRNRRRRSVSILDGNVQLEKFRAGDDPAGRGFGRNDLYVMGLASLRRAEMGTVLVEPWFGGLGDQVDGPFPGLDCFAFLGEFIGEHRILLIYAGWNGEPVNPLQRAGRHIR